MPSATSSAMDPVGMTSTGARPSSPRRMIDPLPNWRSIWLSAASRAFSRSCGAGMSDLVCLEQHALRYGGWSCHERRYVRPPTSRPADPASVLRHVPAGAEEGSVAHSQAHHTEQMFDRRRHAERVVDVSPACRRASLREY